MHMKCIVSDMTHNSCNDCDQMFFPEFKQLVDYSIEKYNALYQESDDSVGQELDSLPFFG